MTGRPPRALEDSAEFVIVGTGAGGATAARVLSDAGYSVIMLEEGPQLAPEDRSRRLVDAMRESIRDMATLATTGLSPMPLLQGRCVGGSTAVNSGIVWRMPDPVRDDWTRRLGLADLVDGSAQDRIFDQIEDELGIGRVPEHLVGGNGHSMRRGAKALGLDGQTTNRNARDCVGSGRCLQGCPEGARQSMDTSYVPRAVRQGARLYPMSRVERVQVEGGRAVGVEGQVLDRHTRKPVGRFVVRARRAVILAASAIQTPMLLRRSGLRRRVGDGYTAHPGAAMVGRFEEQVGMAFGATQSFEVPLHERGIKLESLSLPPELLAARLPGAGETWQRHLRQLDYFAQYCAVVRMEAVGKVRGTRLGAPRVQYEPTARDLSRLKEGVAIAVRMMFAAGADEVYPGIAGLPEVFTDPGEAALVLDPAVQRRDMHLIASHHFGGAIAGTNPKTSVVGPDLQCHELRDLYVMDSSVFPTNLGVNPQHSIMAVAWRAAEQLANRDSGIIAA